jgi:filamentous hemagglutinin family protein
MKYTRSKHYFQGYPSRAIVSLFFLLAPLENIQPSRAEVVSAPNTLPIDSQVQIEIGNNPNEAIYHIQGGSPAGHNLFHSLQTLRLSNQETVIFEPENHIQRIITRVVGSERSFLDGTIQTLGDRPVDLYILNPNGIVLGENAILDVKGVFVGSSADRILFEDNHTFDADPAINSLLSIAVPLGLQFGSNTGTIAMDSIGNLSLSNTSLGGSTGEIFNLIGNDISLEKVVFTLPRSNFQLQSLGNLKLTRINNALSPGAFGSSAFDTLILKSHGNLEVRDSSLLAGQIFSLAAQENLSLSNVYFNTSFAELVNQFGVVADIQLSAQGSVLFNRTIEGLSLSTGQVLLITSTSSNANSGNVLIQSQENIDIFQTILAASSLSLGNSGSLTIEAKGSIVLDGGSFLASDSFINQKAGTIALKAGNTITLDNISALASNNFGRGQPSQIIVQAGGDIHLDRNSLISNNASDRGNAGSIFLDSQAGNIILQRGATIAASTFSMGNAGDINLKAGKSIVLEQGYIYSLTSSIGDGGQIHLDAGEQVKLSEGSTVTTAASFLATGKGGNIQVFAQEGIILQGQDTIAEGFPSLIASNPIYLEQEAIGANINSPRENNQSPLGFAENISDFFFLANTPEAYPTVFQPDQFPFVSIQGSLSATDLQDFYRLEIKEPGTKMVFDVDQTNSNLNASVSIVNETNLILARNRNSVSEFPDTGSNTLNDPSFAFIFPNTGIYFVNIRFVQALPAPANYTLNISRISPDSVNTRFSTQTETSSPAGNLSLQSPQILLQNGAGLEVNSLGTGLGGNIQVRGDRLQLKNKAFITAETLSSQGGNIDLNLEEWLGLSGGSRISTAAGTAQQGGDGGDIRIAVPLTIALPSTDNQIIANAFSGKGGNIQIQTQSILGNPFLTISASSNLGVDGVVNIESPAIDLDGSLIVLPDELLDLSRQIAAACGTSSRNRGDGNRFIVISKSGLQTDPRRLLSQEVLIQDLRWQLESSESMENQPQLVPNPMRSNPLPLKEAQGWIHTAEGNIELVSHQAKNLSLPKLDCLTAP